MGRKTPMLRLHLKCLLYIHPPTSHPSPIEKTSTRGVVGPGQESKTGPSVPDYCGWVDCLRLSVFPRSRGHHSPRGHLLPNSPMDGTARHGVTVPVVLPYPDPPTVCQGTGIPVRHPGTGSLFGEIRSRRVRRS